MSEISTLSHNEGSKKSKRLSLKLEKENKRAISAINSTIGYEQEKAIKNFHKTRDKIKKDRLFKQLRELDIAKNSSP